MDSVPWGRAGLGQQGPDLVPMLDLSPVSSHPSLNGWPLSQGSATGAWRRCWDAYPGVMSSVPVPVPRASTFSWPPAPLDLDSWAEVLGSQFRGLSVGYGQVPYPLCGMLG